MLGKANLGEWANFRGFNPLGFYGWSARGGPRSNPYLLITSRSVPVPGPGWHAVANMCAASVGTETDGSIVGPANANMAVGLKPTLGLVSQAGIIPISHNQDTAGPMGRTVTDIAVDARRDAVTVRRSGGTTAAKGLHAVPAARRAERRAHRRRPALLRPVRHLRISGRWRHDCLTSNRRWTQ